jgi:hypothetical protein
MDLRSRLLQRLEMEDINEIISSAQKDEKVRLELCKLAFDSEDKLSINSLWIMTHYSAEINKWLHSKQNELVDKVLVSKNSSQKRLLLSLIYKQPLAEPLRVDFLDFCLDKMISQKEPHGVTTLCMKLAYEMCKTIPELLQEYRVALDIMEPSLLPPSLKTTRKNILKNMNSKKQTK